MGANGVRLKLSVKSAAVCVKTFTIVIMQWFVAVGAQTLLFEELKVAGGIIKIQSPRLTNETKL
jgi:hypothetical protein